MKRKFYLLIFIPMILLGINSIQGQEVLFEKMRQETIEKDKLGKALKDEAKKQEVSFAIESDCSGIKEQVKNFKEIGLAADEILVVKAKGIPSSGYRWMLESGMGGSLELEVLNLGPSAIPGESAEWRFVLKGLTEGLTSLKFVYKRPWEDNIAPLMEYTLNVNSEGEYTGSFDFKNEPLEVVDAVSEKSTNKALPSSYDWRSQNKVTSVKNQGNTNSCWAFGTCASTEAAILISGGANRDLSEQYLCNCDPSGSCNNGGWFAHWLFKDGNRGAVYESQVPFRNAGDFACGTYTYGEKITKWGWTDGITDTGWPAKTHNATNTQIKEAIYNYGPVAANCNSDCWANSAGIQNVNCTGGAHIITIVGWNDASGGYWIVKNSWGTSWGHNGYLYLRYNTCNMGKYSIYVSMEEQTCGLSINLASSSITNTSAQLDWAPPTTGGQSSWNVRYRVSGTTTWTTKAASASNYSLSGLAAGTTYEWAVQTKCTNGALSEWTSSSTFTTTGASSCGLSINLTATNITNTTAQLDWTPPASGGQSSWNVRYRTVGSSTWTTKASAASNYSLTGLTADTNYEFAVQTVCTTGGTSDWTANSTFKTTGGSTPTGYCAASHTSVLTYFYISNVKFGTINNTTTLGNSSTGYTDHTSISTSLNTGTTQSLSVSFTPNWSGNKGAAYIDWNGDGDFDDSGEQVLDRTGGTSPYTASVTVPAGAKSGTTRMRVRVTYNSTMTPCGSIQYGETEDYTINIGGSSDTQAPSVPTGLSSSNVTQTGATISWAASTDNVGVTSYEVFRGSTSAGTTSSTSLNVTGLSAGTTYSFTVKAKDAAGNVSAASSALSVTTQFETTSCGLSINLVAENITENSAYLDWDPPSSGGHQSWSVRYRASGSTTWTTMASAASNYSLSGLTPNTTYEWQVLTLCTTGQYSAWTANSTFKTTGGIIIPTNYCAASHTSVISYFYISNVTFGSINNTTTLGNSSTGYTDYTSISTSLTAGSTQGLSISFTPAWSGNKGAAYIDWNGDGDFDDSGELVLNRSGATSPYTSSVAVPAGATGSFHMRVRLTYYSTMAPCGSIAYGETEDYTINIGSGASNLETPFVSNIESSFTEPIVFPNPNKGSFKVSVTSGNTGTAILRVIDLNGKIITEKTYEKSFETIEMPMEINLSPGIYNLQIIDGNNINYMKLIIQ